ncbi:MAG: hypothetical protein AB1505_32275 [Candidatus Latescibacterota bacterium]
MGPVLPDLLTHGDGSPVTPATWGRRRQELLEAIIPHQYGGMPPSSVATRALLLCSQTLRTEGGLRYQTYEVRTAFPGGQEVSLVLKAWVPPGDGPFPVVLSGDGCWRYFDDGIVRQVTARGSIAASFDRTGAAADNRGIYRDTGLYRVFPDAQFGALAAWAWAYHRCVDALCGLELVRAAQIAITGHSRGGKAVLLAGATDERIAITNPNDSGIGGSGLNRWKAEGSEVVDDFIRVGSIFWFGPGWAQYQHRDRELPYDQHFLHALVAPRGLLVGEAYGDPGANPPGSYAACQAARAVYGMLGAPEKLGWAVREGVHGHFASDFEALLDFVDWHFHQRRGVRHFQREAYPDLDALLS